MVRFLTTVAAMAMIVTAVMASAAMLDVDGGVIQVFKLEADIELPPPPDPESILATIDIDPNTINTLAGGVWITGYVEFPAGLTEGCSLASIDIATVRVRVLGGTAAVPAAAHPSEIGDEDKDGVPDRHFKFDRSDVVDMIGGDPRWITLEVFGDAATCSFAGTDTVHYGTPVGGPP